MQVNGNHVIKDKFQLSTCFCEKKSLNNNLKIKYKILVSHINMIPYLKLLLILPTPYYKRYMSIKGNYVNTNDAV